MLSPTRLAILGHMATDDFLDKVNDAAEDTSLPDDDIERFEFLMNTTALTITRRTMTPAFAEELAATMVACIDSGENLHIASDVAEILDINGNYSDDIDALMYRDAETILGELNLALEKIRGTGVNPLMMHGARTVYGVAVRLVAYMLAVQK